MRDVPEFKIDEWIRKYGPAASIHLHGSYASALSLNDLHQLSPTSATPIDHDLKLTYGVTKGSVELRERLAELHSSEQAIFTADDVIITPGSILANYLVFSTLFGPGDHVICQYPTFGQLYIVPRQFGAHVSLWALDENREWALDLEVLVASIKPNTKAIILNNPNNPTGAVLSETQLQQIIEIAKKYNLVVFSDEVFRPLFFADGPIPPPLVSLGYPRSVSTGSLSKAYSLPGIRLGWIVTKDEWLKQKLNNVRDYTTISVSQLDDSVAVFALDKDRLPRLLERNIAICKKSVRLIEGFVKKNETRVRWVKPQGAGTAFIQLLGKEGKPLDEVAFSAKLAVEGGLLVIPGSYAFGDGDRDDFKGYVRITLGEPDHLPGGLEVLERFLLAE